MGKSRYKKAKEILHNLKEGKGPVVSNGDLIDEIIKEIGGDKRRTIGPYLTMMLEMKLISRDGENVRIN